MDIQVRGKNIRIPYPVLLLLAAIICYWQFALLRNSMQADIHDVMLPWRYFAGENLQHGMLPLWNPYQQFGYPFYADLQYTNWNPEVWLIGNISGYSYYILIGLVFFYVWMSGVGMFRLSAYFSGNRDIAFFIACSYMLSGVVLSQMQQFVSVIGMAWVPFLIWQFVEFTDTLKWRNVVGISLFTFLLMSSGYQALFFMLVYFFAVISIYKLILFWKQNEKKKIIEFIYKGSSVLILSAMLLLPILVSVIQSAPFVARMDNGVSLPEAYHAQTTPQSLVSFLLPLASVKNLKWLNTDVTVTNIFFGSIAFFLLIFSLVRKQSAFQVIILSFALIYLLAALGEFTPVRKLLYDYLPLMKMFRIAGLFRLIVLALLLMQLSIFLRDNSLTGRSMKIILWSGVALYLTAAIVFWFLSKSNPFVLFNTVQPFPEVVRNAPAWELFFWQAMLFSVICFAGILLLWGKGKLVNWKKLSVISFTMLFIGIQFNIYINIAADVEPRLIQEWIKKNPRGFPLPSGSSLVFAKDETANSTFLGNNMGNFYKKSVLDEFTSFQFNGLGKITDVLPEVRKQFSFYPVAYFSDSVVYDASGFVAKEHDRAVTFIDGDAIFHPDPLKVDGKEIVACTSFMPNAFSFKVKNANRAIFNLLQSYFPGWKVWVDGKEQKTFLNGSLCMSFILQPGVHEITFRYENELFVSVLHTALAIFFLLLSVFLFMSLRGNFKLFGLFPVAVYFFSIFLFVSRKGSEMKYFFPANEIAQRVKKKKNILLSTHFVFPDKNVFYSDDLKQLRSAFRSIEKSNGHEFYYAWYGEQPSGRVMDFLQVFYPSKEIVYADKDNLHGIARFSKKPPPPSVLMHVYYWTNPNDAPVFQENATRRIGDSTDIIGFVTKKQQYGPAFAADYYSISAYKDITLRFSFRFFAGREDNISFLTFVKDSTGKVKWQRGFSLEPNNIDEYSWNLFVRKIKPDCIFRSGDKIGGFLMYTSGDFLLIRDFKAETLDE